MADSYTRPSQLSKIGAVIAASVKNGTTIMGQLSRTLDDITITKCAILEQSIAASGSVTITPANHLGSTGNFKFAFVAVQSNSSSTDMTLELNNSGDAVACEMWCAAGSASMTQIEIAETGTSDALDVLIIVAT